MISNTDWYVRLQLSVRMLELKLFDSINSAKVPCISAYVLNSRWVTPPICQKRENSKTSLDEQLFNQSETTRIPRTHHRRGIKGRYRLRTAFFLSPKPRPPTSLIAYAFYHRRHVSEASSNGFRLECWINNKRFSRTLWVSCIWLKGWLFYLLSITKHLICQILEDWGSSICNSKVLLFLGT